MSVKMVGVNQFVSELSGGNKQKVSFAKWTAKGSNVIIMDCPTRGVDIGVEQAMYALIEEMKKEGKSLEEIAAAIREDVPYLCHWFTVDDLVYLKRGGRVSAAAAFAGSLLNIRPVMHVDDAGKLTGNYVGDIVDGHRKAELLRLIAQVEKVDLEQTIAVGDGANDLPMLSLAGLGIAFHAKPRVVANARQSINTIGIDGVLYFLGFKDSYLHM